MFSVAGGTEPSIRGVIMLTTLLILLLCVGSGTIGGVFFAFSTFVLRALSTIAVEPGIAAMQRINVVVINPIFLGTFLGTAALAAATIVSPEAAAYWSVYVREWGFWNHARTIASLASCACAGAALAIFTG